MTGGNWSEENDGMIEGINVTPLVDITLVLLIVFMVTANYISHQSITVDLPQAATGSATPPGNLNIVLKKTGRMMLNGASTTRQEIQAFIKNRPDKDSIQAVISADEGARHGDVIAIIDFIRLQGVESFAISVETDIIAIPEEQP